MDIATLGIAVRSDQVEKASDALGRLSDQAAKTQGATDRLRDANGRFVKAGNEAAAANDNVAGSARRAALGYQTLGTAARVAMGALSAIAGALATGALIQYADAWSDMQSRVGAAVRDMEAAPALMQRMVDIANASYSPLDQTVEVYSRNVAVLRDLGRGATEAADFTEALNHALVLTATRGERAASVQNALSKAMAVGRLQADGLETVLANGGEVAQVLADQLGTTVSGLRQMATDGKITGDVIATALITRLEDLRDRAGEMPATVGDAFVRLRTNLTAFIGQLDQSTGSSQRLAGAIMLVADNIDNIARVAAIAGVALLTAFAPAILAAISSGLTTIGVAGVAAMRALTIAIMANPLGALAVAITTAITAVYMFRDEIEQAIGVDVVGVMEDTANRTIGVFVGAYAAVQEAWGNLPNFFSAIGKEAWNNLLEGLSGPAITWTNPFTGTSYDILNLDLTGAKAKLSGAEQAALGAATTTFNDAYLRDYIKPSRDVADSSRSAADAIRDMNSAMGEVGGGSGSGGSGGSAGAVAKAIKDVATEADKAAQAAADFVKETAKGFLNDLRSGLEQGKGLFRSFADAAVNALNKVADKLMNMAIDGLFSSSAGGGGIFQSLFGGIGKLFGGFGGFFAEGGTLGAGKWGIAGERGPEIVRGPAQIIPMNRMPTNTNQPQHVVVEVRGTFVDDNGVIKSQVTSMGQQAAQAGATVAVRQVKQALPSMIADSQARKM